MVLIYTLTQDLRSKYIYTHTNQVRQQPQSICPHTHPYVYTHIHMYIHTHIHIYTHTGTKVAYSLRQFVYTHILMYTHTYMCIHTHKHTHIHKHRN